MLPGSCALFLTEGARMAPRLNILGPVSLGWGGGGGEGGGGGGISVSLWQGNISPLVLGAEGIGLLPTPHHRLTAVRHLNQIITC